MQLDCNESIQETRDTMRGVWIIHAPQEHLEFADLILLQCAGEHTKGMLTLWQTLERSFIFSMVLLDTIRDQCLSGTFNQAGVMLQH